MLKTIYLTLGLIATGIVIWQIGFLFNIPGAPTRPDFTITISALTASLIFWGLWLAKVSQREAKMERVIT